jgi:diguanylate cyclase (GGDEF)-like protein/PAS domain S-box-containing protein
VQDKNHKRPQIPNGISTDDLRRRAEEVLKGNPLETGGLSAPDLQFIIHELQVHQVELQLQNEELRRLQLELETSRDNYSNLYDFAPVCYCTLDQKGIIQEANQLCSTIFGIEIKKLIGRPLAHFIHHDDQDTFYLHYRHTLKNWEKQVAELRVVGDNATIHHVQIQSVIRGQPELKIRVVLSDITDRKNVEHMVRQSEANLGQRVVELNALYEATSSLQSTLKTDTLLPRILKSILKAIPAANMGLIYLFPSESGPIHVSATAFSSGINQKRMIFSNRSRYVSRVVATNTYLLLPEIKTRSSNGSETNLKAKRTRSALIVPLITEEQTYGAISLESSEKGAFSMAELNLLESFAATATAALHNARMHEQLQAIAVTDFLTNVYNRKGFFEIGQIEFVRFKRYSRPLSLIMLDIDAFKYINDTYGHAAGDQVLIQLAERIKGELRKSDVFCRYGGDEFLILLPEINLAKAVKTAKRLNQVIEEIPIWIGGQGIHLTISQGVSQATKEMQDLVMLVKQTDDALYLAKAAGRNQIQLSERVE